MRYMSIFSGIEAASVAWEPLGWEPIAFSEIEPFPCAVLERRYPNVPNLGDITKIDWSKAIEQYGKPDLIVGGSPCQSFSIAGGRESLDGESRLMFEYIRAVREVRPRWLLWENVPGALSAKGQEGEPGGAFRQLLEELAECGYGLAWRVLDAQFFGVPQRRRRVFLVGCLGDPERAASVLLEREGMRGDLASSKLKREELARCAGKGADGCDNRGECWTPWDGQGMRVQNEDGVCPTMRSSLNGVSGSTAETVMHRQNEPVPINTMVATRYPVQGRGTGMGVGEQGEASYTISATHEHAVCAIASYEKIVRCKDCRFCNEMHCNRFMFGATYPDGFCAWGQEIDCDRL